MKYPDFIETTGFGTGPGLCGYNCRHSFGPYFEGSETVYNEAELEKIANRTYIYNGKKIGAYDATQLQRHFERQIRRWKREKMALEAAGLPFEAAAAKVSEWEGRMADFLRQTGLKRQREREI